MEGVVFSLIGHRSRCFDIRYSGCHNFALSASEDATAKLWNLKTKKCVNTFKHDDSCEVLRSAFVSRAGDVVCSCGSDGNAVLWKSDTCLPDMVSDCPSLGYSKVATLSHGDQQIYSCETLGCVPSPHIMTASEGALHFWDLSDSPRADPQTISFDTLPETPGASFGGPRNPENKVYVFDAKPAVSGMAAAESSGSPADTLVAVALSDGTVKLIDLRCGASVLGFAASPDADGAATSHVTSVSWSRDKGTIAAAVGCGDLALWDIRTTRIRAYVEDAHDSACFGAVFHSPTALEASEPGIDEGVVLIQGEGCVSWASDGTLRLWDSGVLSGVCTRSDAVREMSLTGYPILCAAVGSPSSRDLLVAGGGSAAVSFIGTLIHSVKFWPDS